ncbi:hypothetical protein WNY58_01070 [Neptuniibacter pectenicola]|jgi:hypothetical protein|uniref:SMODS and SLOG-associating 2TM effector domain-containing protein n=1 Tax=Neptuniibacter pectenicola TaxID=1806669 RepID=A0ABU9TMN4_9GAMM
MLPAGITDEQYDHLFAVRRSVRYHSRRQAYFTRAHHVATVINFVAGSAAVVAALQETDPIVLAIIAATVSAVSAVDMITGNAEKAWMHGDLKKRFINLESEQLQIDTGTNASLSDLACKRLQIEADEPPVHRALDIMCHNELARAMGFEDKDMEKLGWFKRFTAHWFLW